MSDVETPTDLRRRQDERRDLAAREARDDIADWLRVPPVRFREVDGDPIVALAALREAFVLAADQARERRQELEALVGRVAALEAQVRTDHLTGVASRLAVEERIDIEWSRVTRQGHDLALIAVDCDDLKAVNDRFGHPAGDALLREVASRISQVIRTADLVGRVGGDEFLVVCPDTDHESAALVAQKIVAFTSANSLRSPGLPDEVPVSISAGWASAHGQGDWREMVQDADRALYDAKKARRSRRRRPT